MSFDRFIEINRGNYSYLGLKQKGILYGISELNEVRLSTWNLVSVNADGSPQDSFNWRKFYVLEDMLAVKLSLMKYKEIRPLKPKESFPVYFYEDQVKILELKRRAKEHGFVFFSKFIRKAVRIFRTRYDIPNMGEITPKRKVAKFGFNLNFQDYVYLTKMRGRSISQTLRTVIESYFLICHSDQMIDQLKRENLSLQMELLTLKSYVQNQRRIQEHYDNLQKKNT